jgi:hypothetical protein
VLDKLRHRRASCSVADCTRVVRRRDAICNRRTETGHRVHQLRHHRFQLVLESMRCALFCHTLCPLCGAHTALLVHCITQHVQLFVGGTPSSASPAGFDLLAFAFVAAAVEADLHESTIRTPFAQVGVAGRPGAVS